MSDYSFRLDHELDKDPEDSLPPFEECPVCGASLHHKSIEEGCPEVMYCARGHVITMDDYDKKEDK